MKNHEFISWPGSQLIVLTGNDLMAINDQVPSDLWLDKTLAIKISDGIIKIEELTPDGDYVLRSYFRRKTSS